MDGAAALVSCLCVTERRAAFVPWLLWNYQKQDHGRRELVVVDGGEDDWPADVTVVRCPPGTSVARKRNLALDAAGGEIVAWFDDDDWQHPRRLSILAAALQGDAVPLAGSARGWFVDLHSGRARAFTHGSGVIFNGLGARRAALRGERFDEQRTRAADTAWLQAIRLQTRRGPAVVPDVLSFWLCHADNLSNPARRYVFPQPLAAVREAIGAAGWGATDAELAALRDRLANAG